MDREEVEFEMLVNIDCMNCFMVLKQKFCHEETSVLSRGNKSFNGMKRGETTDAV